MTLPRIQIYDTTLRDGTQSEGFSLSANDKVRIAQKVDELGVAFIEGKMTWVRISKWLKGVYFSPVFRR